MWNNSSSLRWPGLRKLALWVCSSWFVFSASAAEARSTNYWAHTIAGEVFVARSGADTFDDIEAGDPLFPGDRIRVAPNSNLTIRRIDNSLYTFGPKAAFQIQAPKNEQTGRPFLRLFSGLLYFFHRGGPSEVDVQSEAMSAATRGTEFLVAVDEVSGTTVVRVIDGIVEVSNPLDTVRLESGEQAVAEVGGAPRRVPAIDAINAIQWILYYPGILDARELNLSDQQRVALDTSLARYESGDLLGALHEYPAEREASSDAERVYRAALLLAVSQVEEAETLIARVAPEPDLNGRLAEALRTLIATVKLRPGERQAVPELATEWMAESYRLQSLAKLRDALQAARNTVARSPQFGFGWARVAELEFGFGHIAEASEANALALKLSPRNAQAVALEGFLLAARNQMDAAIRRFDEAIEIAPGLGNAWLGRGLARIRTGHAEEGRADLLTAAAMEPQRAFLRSYLGKAWADAGERKLAEHELELAVRLDPRDPTAWLYSALLKHQYNRVNEAIRDLEHAQDLNTNRAVYRSGFMLDQDRAVRSANLARIYRDAGMVDWSVREAGRAVAADYGNYSAHLFLASSYDQWRDPNRINLRYETPAEAEYLIANLLAPVGAGLLSRTISQHEYSKLFESDGLGFASSTEYLSRGAWVQNGSVHGNFGNSSFNVEQFYRYDPGQRPNNDYETRQFGLHLKQQLTHKDSIYFHALQYHTESGDVLQYYDPRNASPGLRLEEKQEPTVTLGYHREWSPGNHTLLLATRVDDEFRLDFPQATSLLLFERARGILRVQPFRADLHYRNRIELYSGEAQQIWQRGAHTAVAGVRFQTGDFETRSMQDNVSTVGTPLQDPLTDQEFSTDFQRLSAYAYHHWRVVDSLLFIGGVAYDRMDFPQNFRAPPVNDEQETVDQLSPKAGFIWTPLKNTTFRGAYSRSLSGASLDQSLTLEPAQIAGLNQSFRSLKPESVGGSEAGAELETFALSLEQKFRSNTYVTLAGEILKSEWDGKFGVFDFVFGAPSTPNVLARSLRFEERSLTLSLDQLVGRDLAVGGRFRLSRAELNENFPEIPGEIPLGGFTTKSNIRAILQQAELHAIYNHPKGFFIAAQGLWNHQDSNGYSPTLSAEDFWHFNLFAGYRFLDRRAEITVGLLNLNDQDYRLNPLTLYNELPRERTFYCRLRLNF